MKWEIVGFAEGQTSPVAMGGLLGA